MELLRKNVEPEEDGTFTVEGGVTYRMTSDGHTTTLERITYLAPFAPTAARTPGA